MIDTHIHWDEEAFEADREEVIARQRAEGVEAMIVPGVNVASVESVLDVCRRHNDCCYPALGLHPEDVKEHWEEDLAVIEQAIRAHRDELVAVGEIGLDYYWDKTYKDAQQEVLRRQLALAQELDLPVILHNRDATEDSVHILKEVQPLRGVFHCFNGSKETAEEILKMGFYLGIGGVITFKKCKLADTLKELNQFSILNSQFSILERLVLETDGPYMAPVPHRGERNESRYIRYVAQRLAEVFDCSAEEVIDATSANARRLFRLK